MRSLSSTFVYLAMVIAVASAGPIGQRAAGDPMGKQDGGEATFYDPGMGACGVTSSGADMMAAVSKQFFDTYPGYAGGNPNANPMCGKTATVTYKGKTIKVQLLDRCESCAYIDLDLSPAAFKEIASVDEGRIKGITWQLDGAEGSPSTTSSAVETTSAPAPPETTSAPAGSTTAPPETDDGPEPTGTDDEPEPTGTDDEPEPTGTDDEPEPTATGSTTAAPTETGSSTSAPTGTGEPAPEPSDEPCPPETSSEPAPPSTTTSTEPAPTSTDDEPCPPETSAPVPPSSSEPAPPSTTSPAPPSGGSCGSAKAWTKTDVFVGGDSASYEGKLYTAKWWTQGETPGKAEVWVEKGAC